MLQEIFRTVWELAARGTYMMLCVLVARPLLKKMPRNLTCILWALLALRLLLPLSIPIAQPGSGRVVNDAASGAETQAYGSAIIGAEIVKSPTNHMQQGADSLQLQADSMGKTRAAQTVLLTLWQNTAEWRTDFFRICPFLWAGGAAAVCIYWIAMDLRLKRRVREAVLVKRLHKKIRVMECDRIETAFVLGIFRPAIYLPDILENPDRRYVLLHEKAHLYRKDPVWKWIACMLLCVYWFHPLMWICASAFSRDVEEACDEAVLKKLGEKGKVPYARAIFHEADAVSAGWAGTPGFGEGNMKKRVKHVLDYRKKNAAGVILAAVVILGACGLFFLEKKEGENVKASDTSAEITAEEGVQRTKQTTSEQSDEGAGSKETAKSGTKLQRREEEKGYDAEYVAQNAWTVKPVSEEEMTDPQMAADGYFVMLRRNEGKTENVQLSYGVPVQNARISDTYCVRVHPVTQEERLHSGVDFAADEESPVLAAAPGIVVETGFESYCGNYVIVRHVNGDLTYYAHCAEILKEEGTAVEAGEQIAKVGSTGMSTGPHLHFALSRNGEYIDPFAEPGGFLEEQVEIDFRETLTEAELAETEKIALEYCNQMGWGSVLYIEGVPDDCWLYENEGVEAEYEPGNIIIYAVSTKEDEAAGNPVRTVSVARKFGKLSWEVINGGFCGYQKKTQG